MKISIRKKMHETPFMIAALLTGISSGVLFFGGLWLTIRKAMASKIPALWFLGSFIFRVGIVLASFYLIMQRANWLNGFICLIGFVAARLIVLHLTKSGEQPENGSQKSSLDIERTLKNSFHIQRKQEINVITIQKSSNP